MYSVDMRALVVMVLLAGCAGDDGGGTGGDTSAHAVCVTETNRYRAMNGKADVVRSTQLEEFADTGAMIDFGGSPHQHFSSTQGGGIAFAENECPHWSTKKTGGDLSMLVIQCIAAFYAEGPGTGNAHGHYNNMMGAYATLGCGIYQSGTEVTIVQDYGH
jgi:hypothetical protein